VGQKCDKPEDSIFTLDFIDHARKMKAMSRKKQEEDGDVKQRTFNNFFYAARGTANVNALCGHKDYFDKMTQAEISPFLSKRGGGPVFEAQAARVCHNFNAWIRIYPELVCTNAMVRLTRNELYQMKVSDCDYKYLIKKIPDKVRLVAAKQGILPDHIESMIRSFKFVVEFRHCLQHGGLPWPTREPRIVEKKDFEEVVRMSAPQNFEKTKAIFEEANQLVNLLPLPKAVLHPDMTVEFK